MNENAKTPVKYTPKHRSEYRQNTGFHVDILKMDGGQIFNTNLYIYFLLSWKSDAPDLSYWYSFSKAMNIISCSGSHAKPEREMKPYL